MRANRVGSAMQQLLFWISFVEIISIAALNETLTGGDRKPGDFMFDPLGRELMPTAWPFLINSYAILPVS
jgi:hypothetical protein